MFFNDVDVCWEIYLRGYGAWSTDCGTPRATAFLTVPEANNVPQGAFIGSNFFWTSPSSCNLDAPSHQGHDDVIWACKYAEVIFPKQSFNYFRPCGADRLMPSESFSNRCITGSIGSTLILESAGPATDISTGDMIYVCGTGNLDGLWSASAASPYDITLAEPRFASASQFPSQPIPNCGTGVVYKIRWPSGIPAICGELTASHFTSGSTGSMVTCSISDPTYLITGDSVVITAVTGSPSINGTYTAIVFNSQSIALSGSVGGGNYSSGFIYSTLVGSRTASLSTNTVKARGDYVVQMAQYDYRSVGEYNRVLGQYNWNLGIPYDCTTGPAANCGILPTVPPEPRGHQAECGYDQNIVSSSCTTDNMLPNNCKAIAVYFSPNIEHFLTPSASVVWAKNYWGVPASFSPGDGNYIAMLQMWPNQNMPDPYFVAPPCPCSAVTDPDTFVETHECDPNCSWQEDDGNCNRDVTGDAELGIPCHKYYPMRDQFEARCEPPVGAPPLMNGVYMGCLTTANFAGGRGGTCPRGNLCSPPGQPLYVYPEQGSNICGNNALDPNVYASPWLTLLMREQCVCNAGSFSQTYLDNGIGCPTDVVPAP
jgi:hypothetical protein